MSNKYSNGKKKENFSFLFSGYPIQIFISKIESKPISDQTRSGLPMRITV